MTKTNEHEQADDLQDVEEIAGDESTDWKAEHKSLTEKAIRARERNKSLRENLKTLQTEVDTLKKASQDAPAPNKKGEKSDGKVLERLESMALKLANITADDEKELYNSWKESTGREADEIIGNKIFQAEIADLRTARANQEATSNVSGEKGDSGVKNTPQYWIAKATKGADGKMLFSDEMPKEMYSKVLDTLAKGLPESSENLRFHNS